MSYMRDASGVRLDKVVSATVRRHIVLTKNEPVVFIDDLPDSPGDLIITGRVRGSAEAASNTNLWARINGDGGANYVSNRVRALGATLASDGGAASIMRVCELTAALSSAPMWTDFRLEILDYARSGRYKNSDARYYLPFGTANSQAYGLQGARWHNPNPIRELALYPQVGALLAGSEFTVEIRPRIEGEEEPAPSGFIQVIDGDSISASATGGGSTWPAMLFPELQRVHGFNVAIPSTGLVAMINRAPVDTDTKFFSGWTCISTLFAGTNDLTLDGGATGPEIFSRFQTYMDARGTIGWNRVATTILKRSNLSASLETARTTYNDLVRANWQNHAEVLWDVESLPEFQNPEDTTYFYDGLHPNNIGREVIKNNYKTLLNTEFGVQIR